MRPGWKYTARGQGEQALWRGNGRKTLSYPTLISVETCWYFIIILPISEGSQMRNKYFVLGAIVLEVKIP